MCKELEENRKAVAHLELDQAIKGDPGTAFDYRDEDEADDYRPF
jgi:hypothetical protein